MFTGVPTLPPPPPPPSTPHSQSEVSDLRPKAEATIAHLIFIVSCLCGERTMVQKLLAVGRGRSGLLSETPADQSLHDQIEHGCGLVGR